jgi:hypothetical protein
MIQPTIPLLSGEKFVPSLGRSYRATKPKAFWILKRHFLRLANMAEQTFDKQKSKYATRYGVWDCEKRDGGIYVNVNSIPNRSDYITTDDSKLKEIVAGLIAQEQAAKWAEHGDEAKIMEVQSSMFIAKADFPLYFNKIKDAHTLPVEKCKEYAERWAVWQWVVDNYTRFHYSLEIFYAAYSKVFPNHFKGTHSKIAFKTFHGKCVKDGVEAVVIDKRSVNKVKARRSPFQMALLQTCYTRINMLTAKDAFKLCEQAAKEKGEKPISYSNIKNHIWKEFELNTDLRIARYGATAEAKKTPYASMIAAKNPNTLWQADGKTGAFFVRGDDGSAKRWTVFLVQDSFSTKYVGWAIGERENTELIMAGLENAVSNTGYWPNEFVMDKHSFNRTDSKAQIFAKATEWGCKMTDTTNPQAKAMIERGNQNIDAFWKNFDHFLGKGISAKGKDARPSVEAIREAYRPVNYKAGKEFVLLCQYAIQQWNDTPRENLGGISPSEKYEQGEVKHAIKVTPEDRISLFRPGKKYKVDRGQINIKIGTVKHEFQLCARLNTLYNDREVMVHYGDLSEGIYLYEIKTGAYIDFVYPKQKIHIAQADRTERDTELLNKHTGRKTGTAVQARKKAQEIINQTLINSSEDIDLINFYVGNKDIRQEMENNRVLRQMAAVEGIRPDDLPIRKQKPAIEEPTATKTKATPFASEGTMEFATIEEITGTSY